MQQRLAAVGEMAAGIAHEIRNPLASMAGSIQILRDELPLTDEQSQLMDIVLRESDRLNDTIRSFLAFAQAAAAGDDRTSTCARSSPTRRGCSRTAPELTASTPIAVDVPADAGVATSADEAQIRQIVWNLATNGLRAMPNGGRLRSRSRRGRPTASADGSGHRASSDEGVGIAPEDLDGIFQPFRGGFARGTGLGLSIVHRIVERLRRRGPGDLGARQGHQRGGARCRSARPIATEWAAAVERRRSMMTDRA